MYRPHRSYDIAISTAILAILLLLSLLTGRADGAYPTGCADLVSDGGFEAGGASWTQYSAGGFNLISNFYPHSGQLGAYLGGANNADDRLSQAISLPSGAVSITLRLWWAMTTTDVGGGLDTLTVSLLRPDGSTLATLATLDDSATVNQWDELAFDLTAYAGQNVILRLTGHTDTQYPTDFYVDDVSLIACAGSSPLTATPTVTRTPTPTPTVTPWKVRHKSYLPQIVR
ncbi:MAG: hypothetical protein NT169_19245 [Chloroflexi bacterium]|nr:hypothetical protein [Chloroflexota bacterium]